MEVKDLFSKRYGYDKPETLWEEGLPPDFHAALANTLVNLGQTGWWSSDYYRRVSLRCG
jgi:hypothetical protein